ncbi:MAG: hypothetical protein MI919_27830 [Holophagales bacterium]|nr:hypothetical protein [Holophagales bacterium]
MTKDGDRIEIRGELEVQGRKVVFRLPNGTLSMMRSSEVDLEASRAASLAEAAASKAPPAEAASAPAVPVLVLTDDDIPRAAAAVNAVDESPKLPAFADREPVQVVDWSSHELEDGGLELRGIVHNTGRYLASNITVRAAVNDGSGRELANGLAFLGRGTLLMGRSTDFRIIFPDLDTLPGNPVFTVRSDGITMGAGRDNLTAEADDEPGPRSVGAASARTPSNLRGDTGRVEPRASAGPAEALGGGG